MKRLLLYFVAFICATQVYAVPNLSQTDYRWRNDDGDETTATWAAATNTSAAITANGVTRLRIELLNNGLTAATISQNLEYSSNGGATWSTMTNNASTDSFLYLSSTFVADGAPTTAQSTGTSPGTFVAGKIISTPGATAQQSLNVGEKTEYEWVLGPNPALPPLTNIDYIFRASGLNTQPTVYPTLVYLFSPTGCFGSGSLTSSNITSTSADLAWTEYGPALQWEIEYGLGNAYTLGTGTRVVTSSNPYTLTLPSNSIATQYSYFVRSICGINDTSAWSARSSFTLLPSCPTPTSPTATNITINSADLGWTENGTATSWEVEYATGASFTLGSGTRFVAANNPETLGTLSPSTSYSYFVRSICGVGDTSAWSGRGSFVTPCVAVSVLPWAENFDALGTLGSTSFPPCWVKENGDWATSNAAGSSPYAIPFSGPNFLRNSWSATNEYMWTPGFDLVANTSYDFSFYVAGDGATGWTLDVYQNSSPISTGATQLGSTYNVPATTCCSAQPYSKQTYTFVPSTTGTFYFALNVNQPSGAPWYLGFDDFMVELTPSCPAPVALTTANATANSADLQWTEPGTATQWEIEYGQGTSYTLGTGTRVVVSGNPYTLSGLTQGGAGGQYSYFVRSICGVADTSLWSSRKAITLIASCDTPSAPAATNITAFTADLGWTENGTATQWQIEYGTGTGFAIGTGTRTYVSSNPFTLSTLNQGTQYSYFVRAVCGLNDTSAWSPRANFTTSVVCPSPTAMSFSNITGTSFDVAWTASGGAEILEYGPTGYVPGNGAAAGTGGTLITGATPPITINGLTASSGYDVFIRQDCLGSGNGFSVNLSGNVATTGAPANDTLCGAYNVVLNNTTPVWVNTVNATASASDPTGINGCTTPNNNVWYQFTTTNAGVYTITAYASSVNVASLYGNMSAWAWLYSATGTCPSLTLTQVADLTTCSVGFPGPYNTATGVPANTTNSVSTPGLAAATTYYMVLDGNSGAYGNIGVTVQSPLAIKLGKITAFNIGAANRVEWNTLSEEATDRFELERSIDGKNFTRIYGQRARGEASRYTYVDNDALKGNNYYRLRMIEANGNADYSQTVVAFVKSNGFEVEAFPNPVSNNLTVRAHGVQGSEAYVQVTDVTGKVIKTVKMSGNSETIDMKGLASGMYLIKYMDSNHQQTLRVTKQ